MKLNILCLLLILMGCTSFKVQEGDNILVRNRMAVEWQIVGNNIRFEIRSPEHGWVAIAFNTSDDIEGAYLVMGRIQNGKAEVKDFYVLEPGNYRSIEELGRQSLIQDVSGREGFSGTTVAFTLPMGSKGKYYHELVSGKRYTLHMAYSLDDDFKHHSIMRTSTKIKL